MSRDSPFGDTHKDLKDGRHPSARSILLAVASVALVLMMAIPVGPTFGADSAPALKASEMSVAAEPVAVAGSSMSITVGEAVFLNGTASAPSDGATITSYFWTLKEESGSKREIYNYSGPMFNFTFNDTGLFACNLTITDSNGLNDTDSFFVSVRPKPQTFLEKYMMVLILVGILIGAGVYFGYGAFMNRKAGLPVIATSTKEKYRLGFKRWKKILKQLLRNPMGAIGVLILVVFIFIAAFGPWLAPYDVKTIDPFNDLQKPSKAHWMGTDNFGIDIFSELLYGARTSIIVGIVSAVIASFLGAAVGLYSGYVGGWKDEVVMRLNDIVLSIPWLVLMIVVAAFVGKIDLTGIILIIGLTGWSTTARMVRAQVLSIRERQYIERARSIGSSELAIIRRHVFPNTFPLVFANTILTVAVSILSEATLSFLGLRPVGVVTWGTMLSFASEASAFQQGLHMWILAPGLCIVAVVLGFTLLGYALDEILNPKLRHR
jgi:peptide/nickel transport system permease protein